MGDNLVDGGLEFILEGLAAAERSHDNGFDDEEDVVAAGVVGTDLGAFVRVEDAFEEGAEDGGFDAGPVLVFGEISEGVEVAVFEGNGRGVVEEAAVEPGLPARRAISARRCNATQSANQGDDSDANTGGFPQAPELFGRASV